MTAPMSRKASSRRTSIDISLGGFKLLPPLTGSGIQKNRKRAKVTGRDRTRRVETDGSARGVAGPSRHPWPRRNVRRLRAYIPNNSGRSGTRRAERGRHQPYIRGGTASRSIAAEKETVHFAPDLRDGSVEGFAAGIDDNGPLGIQPIEAQANRLTNAPADRIPHDGFTDCAGESEADMRAIGLRFTEAERGKERTGKPAPLIIHASKIFGTQQADTFRKTRYGDLPLRADREFLTATGAATGKDSAAVLGFHTGAEAMGLGAVAIIRLKSTFRHCGSRI